MTRPSSERDGECCCDYNPSTTNGPEENSPFHGRPYAYWVARGDELRDRAEAAESALARVRAISDQLFAELMTGPTTEATERLGRNMLRELRAAIDGDA